MKREEILKKAIEKAVGNGWLYFKGINKDDMVNVVFDRHGLVGMSIVLFDHSFCKAFAKYINETGQADKLKYCGVLNTRDGKTTSNLFDVERSFKIDLVLSEDRLEYIARFLK